MDEPTVVRALLNKQNSGAPSCFPADVSPALREFKSMSQAAARLGSFLRIPPFPGAKIHNLEGSLGTHVSEHHLDLIRRLRVGGSYWAAQPDLPPRYVLVRCPQAIEHARSLSRDPVILWGERSATQDRHGALIVTGDADPWHMLSGATALVIGERVEQALVAAILGVPVYEVGAGRDTLVPVAMDLGTLLGQSLAAVYDDPFDGSEMSLQAAIELCGFWRQLIESNRGLSAGIGFAFWKRDHIAPLLWSGHGVFRFLRNAREATAQAPVAIWRAKTPDDQLATLEAAGTPLVEVEDGFLRSQGLGADCIPPLSVTVDRLGAHFEASRPSELEQLLQEGQFDHELLDRAQRLREVIVEAGLGKYEHGGSRVERRGGERVQILVPGQVEDDRAVVCGGCGLTSNLELLARVRAQAPDAYILYKPHPDVLAGHRRGAISEELCLRHANEIVTFGPISSLIDAVDEVHVNTSLAGFEALVRGKIVTTYGVPFYAGWGLTRDLGPVPARRTARRSLNELIAATLLIYPRYLDPITGLPCPAEVVVDRLCNDSAGNLGLLVRMRRLQGRLLRSFRSVVQ